MRVPSRSIRHIAVAGAAVVVLAGSAVGIAAAQATPTPTTTTTPTTTSPSTTTTPQAGQPSGYQKFIDALAKRLNVSTQTLQTAVTQARQDAGLPANGQGFPGGGERGHRGGFRVQLDAAATAIGIPADQLRTELAGKSLAQVAQAHGKSAADVATALKNAAHQRIDAAVTAGKLTADQANTQKTQADQRIDQVVNQVMPQGGPGNGRGGFGGGGILREGLQAAANAIGITPAQLRTEISGKSLADVAQAHGKSATDVATALKDAAHQRIDAAVTAGKLQSDQASSQKARTDQMIDQFINQPLPQLGAGADNEANGA